jgi:hypothetical protein
MKNISQPFVKLVLLIGLTMIAYSVSAQESEPNDNIGDSNIYTIDTLGIYTGQFQQGGDIDLWYLAPGSKGDIILDIQFFASPEIIVAQIHSNTGGYNLFGIDPNAVIVGTATPGTPANATLDSTLYYTIFVADEFINIDSTYILTLSGSGALPVELTSFSGTALNGGIMLNWKTATELNNYGFEVQRRDLNSSEEWMNIGFIQGYGNSSTYKEYSYFDKNPPQGKLNYRLKQIDNDGSFEYSKVINVLTHVPKSFQLFQNFPNPFNPSTEISYSLKQEGFITIKIYDVLGNDLLTLVNEQKTAGVHSINFDANNFSSGIYFYEITAEAFSDRKKMLLIK